MQVRLKNRKQQIVATALDLLQTHGFENFSYLDIANRLEITKASVHHHFPKKTDLGVALCQAISDWHKREFTNILSMDVDADTKLSAYFNELLRFVCGKNKICPLSSLQSDITTLPVEMRKAIAELDIQERAFIAQILEQGVSEGSYHFCGDVQTQALIIVLTSKAALQYSRLHGVAIFEQVMKQINQQLVNRK